MLIEHFYTLTHIKATTQNAWSVTLKLNPQHVLYEGHFPGYPIVPGVCMLQLIKECVEKIKGKTLQYAQIASCKFLAALNPIETPTLVLELTFNPSKEDKLQILAEGKTENNGEKNHSFNKLKAQLIEK